MRESDAADAALAAQGAADAVLRVAGSGPAAAERLVALPDDVGLEELAAVWGRSAPDTLPGALWALYLLRAWSRSRPGELAALLGAGRRHAEVAAGIAGLPDPVGAEQVGPLADELLRTVLAREAAAGLERAAAVCRVVAAGRGELGEVGVDPTAAHAPAATLAEVAGWRAAVLGVRLLSTAAGLDRLAVAMRAPAPPPAP